MNHNPELAQTLPARELHELVTGDEYSAILVELESLPDSDDAIIKKERSELLGRLRGLKLSTLKKYREQQRENPFRTAKTEDVGHYCTPFSRIRHLMPIRERLAESLFTVATIRSKAGRAFLEDRVRGRASTWLRAQELPLPGPERVRISFCCFPGRLLTLICEQGSGTRPLETHLRLPQNTPHVEASKPLLFFFAEFCFLCTNGDQWYTSQDSWKSHCESHLANLDTLPYQCGPLTYAKTLAAPGLYFWCLGGESLPPTRRMQEFLTRAQW